MKKSSQKKIISILITAIILILMAFFLYKNKSIFKEITTIKIEYIVPIAILMFFFQYLNGVFLKILVKPYKIDLKEHFPLSISANFLNTVIPLKGGTGMRAIYMKKKYDLKYSDFLSSLFGNYVIVFLVCAILGLTVFSIIYFIYGIYNLFLFLLFGAILFGTLASLKLTFKFKKENFITKRINRVLKGWEIIKNHKRIIPKLIIIPILGRLLYTLIILFAFAGIGIEISFWQALYLSVFQLLALFINITPGSLGITETFFYLSSEIVKIQPEIALLVALIIRGINLILLLILAPIAHIILLKRLNKATDPGLETTAQVAN